MKNESVILENKETIINDFAEKEVDMGFHEQFVFIDKNGEFTCHTCTRIHYCSCDCDRCHCILDLY